MKMLCLSSYTNIKPAIIFVFVCISLGTMPIVHAQERENLDPETISLIPIEEVRKKDYTRTNIFIPDTLKLSADKPFFDDFSSETIYPDSALWLISGRNDFPLVSIHTAIDPPSQGVLTFDGSRVDGVPYVSQALSAGQADVLESHCIDLSGFDQNDGLVLNFFVQAQGLGNAPEPDDYFQVLFRINPSVQSEPLEVLRIKGDAVGAFRQYRIQLDKPFFFHKGFQMLFRSVGSQNGPLDHWHLDYVTLALGQTAQNTAFEDQNWVEIKQSPFDPYTAYPLAWYKDKPPGIKDAVLVAGNRSSSPIGTKANFSLSLAGNTFHSSFMETGLLPIEKSEIVAALPTASPAVIEPGVLTFRAQLDTKDAFQQNNLVQSIVRIDSILALDDGEADLGYGLNKARGFATLFHLPPGREYTLSAIWLQFVPRLNVNETNGALTYMEDRLFRPAIWYKAHPDSLLRLESGNYKVSYRGYPQKFIRFALTKPLLIKDSCWIGVQQVDNLPLGLGFDRNPLGEQTTWWDSSGVWVRSQLLGSLMIRPEILDNDISTGVQAPAYEYIPQVYPNPVSGDYLYIESPGSEPLRRAILRNLQGGIVIDRILQNSQDKVFLPPSIANGIYFLTLNGVEERFDCKILIYR